MDLKIKYSLDPDVLKILDALAKEHGSETFVSSAYAYYEDAAKAFSELIRKRETAARALT